MLITCPICKKQCTWENNPSRPFCSDRCKLIDLGEWASGKRGVPGDHAPETEGDSKPKIPDDTPED